VWTTFYSQQAEVYSAERALGNDESEREMINVEGIGTLHEPQSRHFVARGASPW
jgi:hypothetical protein